MLLTLRLLLLLRDSMLFHLFRIHSTSRRLTAPLLTIALLLLLLLLLQALALLLLLLIPSPLQELLIPSCPPSQLHAQLLRTP